MKEAYPFISVVITGKNALDTIEECLSSVIRNNYPPSRFEIIYVDGGSTDGTLDVVKKISETFREKTTIRWYVKIGPPGAGRNKGILEAKGEIIAFTDSDVIVDENWLRNIAHHLLETDERVAGIGGPNLTPPSDPPFAQLVGALWETPFGSMSARNPARYKGIRPVDHNPSCNAAYWKWVFEKVGLFREDLPVTEDVELDTRIRKSGYILLYVDEIIVWHHRRKTLKSFLRQMYSYGYWRAYSARRRLIPLSPVHFMPAGFLLYLPIVCPAVAMFEVSLLLLPIIVYVLFGLFSGFYIAMKRRDPKLVLAVPALGFLEHVAYGAGFIVGFLVGDRQ
jgi:glycosyltransferase involved in cell wall biosynthesis